ncbi:MAG: sigma-70 family RNA polymerase sigma factor [Prevotella sp.]|jgi:RNA polymerase sigma factor (sigma-70 family)|nr:sigma-70 family RNA polymerase sigma factor [Prevotella sp.]MCI1282654.1 sigma-70 family RNA polymerase sigma factor [Prevotella sp.]
MDETEFADKVPRLRAMAVAKCLSMGFNREDAYDITQEAMIRLWQIHDTIEPENPLDALVKTIVRRLSLNYLRHPKCSPMAENMQIFPADDNPALDLEQKENEEWLTERLEELPDTQHAILYMRQVEGRKNKEIATLLGIQESSVSTLLARARKSLLDEIRRRRR